MTVLVVDNVAKFFGAERVFAGVTFTVAADGRVGLVGPNGSGKTTLLETIAGRLPADEGHIHLVGRPRVGYLEQEVRDTPGDGPLLFDYVLGALSDLTDREERLRRMEQELAGLDPESPRLAELMADYGALRDAYEHAGGYQKETRGREVLFGLGFADDHLELPIGRLSGGQRTRARLARLLLEAPELLMLDEPTNHLDLGAVEWLESFLATFPGAVLTVSHDRYFLDAVARRILELDRGRLTGWTGNYTAYVAQKEQWLTEAEQAYERQQEEIDRLEDYVRRYKAGNRATMAKSREKALARLERVERPPTRTRTVALRFGEAELSGREVLKLERVGLAFTDGPAERWLFNEVNASVRRGQRVALLGRNGTGKTTLLEVIMDRRELTAGRVVWGANVRVAYFSQGLDQLSDDRTVLEEAMAATGFRPGEARSFLGRFLFSGDDVNKPVAVLSGGERNRLVLACLVSSRPNVLVLDEPTNHLDLPAREVLERALQEFGGSIVFVSHDRYFVERLATRIWELDAGTLVEFEGGYAEYRLSRADERARRVALETGRALPAQEAAVAGDGREAAQERAAQERAAQEPTAPSPPPLSKGRRARLEQELNAVETEITRLERRRGELEAQLADPASYRQGAGADLQADYQQVLRRLEQTVQRWEELASTLGDA